MSANPGKFVIANPFGPWKEPRFTAYLARCWLGGETACPLELLEQTEFPEPRVRMNTDPLDPGDLGWGEA